MKYLILSVLFLPSVLFAGQSDIATFMNGHADMFQQLSSRYNDRTAYKLSRYPGQKAGAVRSPGAGGKSKSKTAGAAATTTGPEIPPPTTQTFTGKSAWSDMKATIINYHTHFVGKIETTAPAEKWILKNGETIVTSGSVNDLYNFTFDVPGEFKPGLDLTIMVIKDESQYPSLIELH